MTDNVIEIALWLKERRYLEEQHRRLWNTLLPEDEYDPDLPVPELMPNEMISRAQKFHKEWSDGFCASVERAREIGLNRLNS